jgi:hypothetical protein
MTMFGDPPAPTHMPCVDCGASVAHAEFPSHVCDPERLHRFRLFPFRDEIEAFDTQLDEWLASARGRFAIWVAERDRRGLTA